MYTQLAHIIVLKLHIYIFCIIPKIFFTLRIMYILYTLYIPSCSSV